MAKKWVFAFLLISVVFFTGFSSVSATPPVKIVSGVVSNLASVLWKWLWSLKTSSTKPAVSSRSMMKFESGYTVETVFDGSKLGIEPYSVEISPDEELLVLDSENSNLYKVSMPLSRYSRPKLVAGSSEGYSGHVDGKLRESRLNHPKGLTVDGRGNIYVADTTNMAIRKISDTGVSTIAGGQWSRGGGHVDGPSEDAKFSSDFDLVYVASSCSLLVIDRGNRAIREIRLDSGDCSYEYDGSFNLGIAVLGAAGFFGYMLALLQRRVQALFSSHDDTTVTVKNRNPVPPYHRPHKSVRPPLIPPENHELDTPEEGFFGSVGKLVVNTSSSVAEIFGGIFSSSKRKPVQYHQLQHHYQRSSINSNGWPMQESFLIPDEDQPPPPPSLETRNPNPKRTYPFTTKEVGERKQQPKQTRGFGWDDDDYDYQQRQQMQMQHHHHHQNHQQQHNRNYSLNTQTHYEKKCETNEIVFGAVQEQDGRREAVVIKAVDYGKPEYSHHHQNIRPRINYMGSSYNSHGY